MKRISCGCCDGDDTDDKCVCSHHMDIPMGTLVRTCVYHQGLARFRETMRAVVANPTAEVFLIEEIK